MTYSEFRYTLKERLLGIIPTTIILNYNPIVGSSPATATIDDIAILIENNNLAQLLEATAITLVLPETDGKSITINVEVSTNPVRNVERGVVRDYFCYSIITPEQRPIIKLPPQPTENFKRDVIVEPIVAKGAYNYNTYNPLIGNSIIDRESSYIVHSDRGTTTPATRTNPVNINNILLDKAVHASVQDSLYSDTGWTHGRYEGSKLTYLNNGGTDPILQGTFFEAAFFGADVLDTDIDSIASTDLSFKQYLSSGKASPPIYEVGESVLVYSIQGTVVQKASQGKLRVKETGTILHINSFGYIVAP